MIFKVSTLLLSDSKLCHLFHSRILYFSLVSKRFLTVPGFSQKYLNYKYFSVYHKRFKMCSSAISSAIFQGKGDRFEGITVFSDQEPCDITEFPDRLKNSLISWRCNKKRGIWFKVHLDHSEWVPILIKNGFKYHHAKEDYVMLYLWLPHHESSNIPNYAHTMVGVGAVVVNDRNQVLVVKEKYFYKVPMWKLPGGYVEPGENLVDAAIREVMEETGIPSEFQTVLTLRQAHRGMFECSDMYVVVNLKPLSEEIHKCDREIAECQWMDIEEYLNHPQVHELNRFFVSKLLHYREHNLKIDCHHCIHQVLQKPYIVYHAVKADNEEEAKKVPLYFQLMPKRPSIS